MNSEINYYYKIYPDKIYNSNDNYYFFDNGKKYYLILYTGVIEELSLIITIINEYVKRNILIDRIEINTEGSYISNINGKNYILLIKNDTNNDYDLDEIISFDNILKTNKIKELGYTPWNILWSRKVDYYEEKIVNIINKNDFIKYTFDYYIGLAENAICYVKYAYMDYKFEVLMVGHKRFNNNLSNIRNPFNLVIDYEVRDIAEYVKYKFFNDYFSMNELISIIEKKKYNIFEIRLLFGRLMYPNYYFDLIDEAIKSNNVNDGIESTIKKINEYEKLLYEIYNYLLNYYKIPRVNWLIK